jgi:DNA modification methylase
VTVGRKWGNAVRAFQREHVKAREALEEKYEDLLAVDDTYADLVTGEQTKDEPYHRWLPFRQQFAPALVRRFLAETAPQDPVLDPFSGSGTVAIECARSRRAGIGVEGIPVLAWLARARFCSADDARLAAILEAGRAVTGEGRRKAAAPAAGLRDEIARMIAEDRARPILGSAHVIVGDARALPLAERSVGGVLTSPPYLSRYDYSRITGALDAAWRRGAAAAAPQLPATLKARGAGRPPARRDEELPAAACEAIAAVRNRGRKRDADTIATYFGDLMRTLSELHRVTRPGAPVWVVIGAAEIEREYVPSDLIAAELAVPAGFRVTGLVEARRLRQSGRLLGDKKGVSPRESIVKLVHA